LCRPERKMKWPSSSAPVLRNSARRSSLMRTNENDRQDARRPHRLEAYVPLPGSVIRRLLGLPGICNSIDLYLRSLGQRGDLDSGTGRGILFEIRAINFVHGLEISQIGEENSCLNDVIKSEPFGSQNGCDVVQHAPRLRRDIAGNNLARLRIERNLTAAKEETSAAHSLRVGADRPQPYPRKNASGVGQSTNEPAFAWIDRSHLIPCRPVQGRFLTNFSKNQHPSQGRNSSIPGYARLGLDGKQCQPEKYAAWHLKR